MIGVHLGCCVDPALMQAKARAALALARPTHSLCRVRSAGFAGSTGAFLGCFHSNKCNMLRLLEPLSGHGGDFECPVQSHGLLRDSGIEICAAVAYQTNGVCFREPRQLKAFGNEASCRRAYRAHCRDNAPPSSACRGLSSRSPGFPPCWPPIVKPLPLRTQLHPKTPVAPRGHHTMSVLSSKPAWSTVARCPERQR